MPNRPNLSTNTLILLQCGSLPEWSAAVLLILYTKVSSPVLPWLAHHMVCSKHNGQAQFWCTHVFVVTMPTPTPPGPDLLCSLGKVLGPFSLLLHLMRGRASFLALVNLWSDLPLTIWRRGMGRASLPFAHHYMSDEGKIWSLTLNISDPGHPCPHQQWGQLYCVVQGRSGPTLPSCNAHIFTQSFTHKNMQCYTLESSHIHTLSSSLIVIVNLYVILYAHTVECSHSCKHTISHGHA